jgi:IS30 family transposase
MCYAHLTQAQRYQIESLLQAQSSVECIARKLRIHRSTVYRELNRCPGRSGYVAWRAQEAAERRIRRSAANHPSKPAELWRRVRRYVRRDWSPEQVNGWLHRFSMPLVSAPAIYAHIQADRRGGGFLHQHLRYSPRVRPRGYAGGLPRSRPNIRQRPRHVSDRLEPGHWEGDTFVDASRRHHTLTLVERTSRFMVMRHPPDSSKSASIGKAAIEALGGHLVRSITFDNGAQFAAYEEMSKALGCSIYFADPYRPNQRATCENTIGLVRQYIPKGSCGHRLTPAQLQSIADKLNHRPRKCLGFKTPYEVKFGLTPVALRT